MAISRKKARKISVDGADYHWAVSEDSGYSVVVVQSASGSGCKLETVMPWPDNAVTDAPASSGPAPVTPAQVADTIRAAMALGWCPDETRKSTFPCKKMPDGTLALREPD